MNKAEKVEQRGKGISISLYLQRKDNYILKVTQRD
jgi:hypothetical protein